MYKDEIAPKVQRASVGRFWLLEAAPRSDTYRQVVASGAAIVLLLLVTWLGARGLNADALWFDEVWSLYYAGGAEFGPISPAEVIARVGGQLQHEKNPPGYYVMLNLWGGAVGWSEYAGRTLSLLMGLLAVAWTYRLGCDIAPTFSFKSRKLVGLGAAVALGGSAFFSYYTYELRAYVPSVLLTVFTSWAYCRLMRVKRKPVRLLQATFALGVAGSLYIHYSSLLVLGAIGLYHLLLAPKNARWWRVTLLLSVGGALFLPWAGSLLLATQRAENLSLTALTTPELLKTLAYVFSNGSVALLALVAAYAVLERRQAGIIWFLALAGMGLALALNTIYPVISHIRYVMVLWPLLGLVVGLGVERLAQKGVAGWVVLTIWIGAGLWNTFDPTFNRTLNGATMPWREFRAELSQYGQADDVVVFHAPDYYWFRDLEMQHYMYGLPMRYSLMEQISGLEANDEYYQNALNFVDDADRIWIGVDRMLTPNFRLGQFERLLSENYAYCTTPIDEPDMTLDLYARAPAGLDSLAYRFGDGIGMQIVEPARVLSDGKVTVMLGWWVADDVPADTYSVGLHVVDQAGNLVAQADYGLPASSYSCAASVIEAPAGEYALKALVYNWQTGERLDSTGSDEPIPIATIAVQ